MPHFTRDHHLDTPRFDAPAFEISMPSFDKPVALTDFHKMECLEALNEITLRLRVGRSHIRWNKDSLATLKKQRKILQTHVNKLNTDTDVKQDYLRQVDNDLEAYRILKV